MRKFFLIFSGIILLISATALIYTTFFYSPTKTMTGLLEDRIPKEFPGWTVQDQDLASSPEQVERVEAILNFTQAIFRSYERAGTNISVYIAYWEPKTMPVRQVQSHTPDVCWVRSGWTLTGREESVPCEVDGINLFPSERRVLQKDGHTEYVAYWHVLGDHIYVNRTAAGQWDRWDPIKTLLKYGLHQQREQFFVRISSNRPINEIWDLPLMQEIMRDLAQIMLTPPAAPESSEV